MEFPFGHHHHRRDEGEEDEQYPFSQPPQRKPPSYYESNDPPPPQATHVYHSSHVAGEGFDYPPPPPPHHNPGYDVPPDYYNHPPPPSHGGFDYSESPNISTPTTQVTHVQHVSPSSSSPPPPDAGFEVEEHHTHHHHRPHFPSFVHHVHHQHQDDDGKPTVRVFCKAETNYSLTVLDGKVVLARSDPSDPFQHWIKDQTFSTKVKDEERFPSFALVNKATGLAMKHSVGATHPVQLTPFVPNVLDESILWTESKDLGDGFRAVRMVNNIRLNVDAFNGDKNHGGVRDGTIIVLWEWKKGDNQRWKIVPY